MNLFGAEVDRSAEGVCQFIFNSLVYPDAVFRFGEKFDHDVHIGIAAEIAARDRAEDFRLLNPVASAVLRFFRWGLRNRTRRSSVPRFLFWLRGFFRSGICVTKTGIDLAHLRFRVS